MTQRVLIVAIIGLLLLGCIDGTGGRPANFAVVEKPSAEGGGLYRGGRPSPEEIAALQRDLRIRTLIRLNRGDAAPDRAAAKHAGVRLVEIPINPKKLGTADGVTSRAVERAFAEFANPRNAPVYIYCDHGRDRTGYVVALYRIRKQAWQWPAVSAELEQHGHGTLMRRYLPHITRQLRAEAQQWGVRAGRARDSRAVAE